MLCQGRLALETSGQQACVFQLWVFTMPSGVVIIRSITAVWPMSRKLVVAGPLPQCQLTLATALHRLRSGPAEMNMGTWDSERRTGQCEEMVCDLRTCSACAWPAAVGEHSFTHTSSRCASQRSALSYLHLPPRRCAADDAAAAAAGVARGRVQRTQALLAGLETRGCSWRLRRRACARLACQVGE